jgi:hypothetical protein
VLLQNTKIHRQKPAAESALYSPHTPSLAAGTVLGYGLDDRGFKSQQGLSIFLLTTPSRSALEPTQPTIQWVRGGLSLGVKWPGREADHSPQCSVEVKNVWSYTSTPPIRLHGVVLS